MGKYKHGLNKTREHNIWLNMKSRCFNKNNYRYIDYGGRGITVCESWRTSFINFITDMGMSPTDKHQIERLDNNGNYEPSNCVWSTAKAQANNRRTNRNIEYKGKTQTLAQWCDELGIEYFRTSIRIRHGWTIEMAFSKRIFSGGSTAISQL